MSRSKRRKNRYGRRPSDGTFDFLKGDQPRHVGNGKFLEWLLPKLDKYIAQRKQYSDKMRKHIKFKKERKYGR